jgi:hypothetical protein
MMNSILKYSTPVNPLTPRTLTPPPVPTFHPTNYGIDHCIQLLSTVSLMVLLVGLAC